MLASFLQIQMTFYKHITIQSESVTSCAVSPRWTSRAHGQGGKKAPNADHSYLRSDLNHRPGEGLGGLLIVIPQVQVAEGNWCARNPQHRSPLIKCHITGTAGHNA